MEVDSVMKRVIDDPEGLEQTSDADRVWFKLNPNRHFRIRGATAHEKSTGTHPDQVLVCQIATGARVRISVVATGCGDLDEIPEPVCVAMFEYITSLDTAHEIRRNLRKTMAKKYPKLWRDLLKSNPIAELILGQAKRSTKH